MTTPKPYDTQTGKAWTTEDSQKAEAWRRACEGMTDEEWEAIQRQAAQEEERRSPSPALLSFLFGQGTMEGVA